MTTGLQVERFADDFSLTWPQLGVGMIFERIHEARDDLTAMVTVQSARHGQKNGRMSGPSKLNLVSTPSQKSLAGLLEKRDGSIAWLDLVVHGCATVVQGFLAPSPTVLLEDVPERPIRYLDSPSGMGLLPEGETIGLYGDSESLKSMLALRIGLSMQTGLALPWGAVPVRGLNVLYLDWETTDSTIANYARRLAAGMEGYAGGLSIRYRGTLTSKEVRYLPLRMLQDEVGHLREQIARENIGLVIVDSLSFAVSGKLGDDDIARGAMQNLRLLGPATRLVVMHISHASVSMTNGRVDPFGSVFLRAGIRSGIQAKRSEESRPGTADLGVYHWKSNPAEHQKPFGLRVCFEGMGGPIRMHKTELAESDDLYEQTPLMERLLDALRRGSATTDAVAARAHTDSGTARTTLNRLKKNGRVVQIDAGGPGRAAVWGLAG